MTDLQWLMARFIIGATSRGLVSVRVKEMQRTLEEQLKDLQKILKLLEDTNISKDDCLKELEKMGY